MSELTACKGASPGGGRTSNARAIVDVSTASTSGAMAVILLTRIWAAAGPRRANLSSDTPRGLFLCPLNQAAQTCSGALDVVRVSRVGNLTRYAIWTPSTAFLRASHCASRLCSCSSRRDRLVSMGEPPSQIRKDSMQTYVAPVRERARMPVHRVEVDLQEATVEHVNVGRTALDSDSNQDEGRTR